MLGEINSKLWLGHFDLSSDPANTTCSPCFRYTSLMPGGIKEHGYTFMKELFSYTLTECERLHEAMMMLDDGTGHAHSDKMKLMMAEAVGSCSDLKPCLKNYFVLDVERWEQPFSHKSQTLIST